MAKTTHTFVAQEFGHRDKNNNYVSGPRTDVPMSRAAAEAVFDMAVRVDAAKFFYVAVHRMDNTTNKCTTIRWAEAMERMDGTWGLIEKEA